jgi:peptide/nickel transport system permease protein
MIDAGPSPSPALVHRRLLQKPGFQSGIAVLGLVLACALAPWWIAPHDPNTVDLPNRLAPPVWMGGSWEHPLGADGLGRDYLSRLVFGAQTSVIVSMSATCLSALIGCTIGIVGGFLGGRFDFAANYLITVRLAMPAAVLVLAIIAVIGPSLLNLILVIGLLYWPAFAIVSRTAVMEVRSMDFVAAAVAVGSSRWQIVREEVLPNIFGPLMIVATLQLGAIVLAEASLSFLGLGIQPPLAAWGLMVNESKQFMHDKPWMLAAPALCILVLVLSLNMVGEALREALDPIGRSR